MRRKITRWALTVVVLLLLCCSLWTFWTRKAPEIADTNQEYLLVPRDLAGRFELKGPEAVIAWCRDHVRPETYEGVFRGGHGALWAGQANAYDRVLLAEAALAGIGVEARVVPGEPPRLTYHTDRWTTVRLDADQPSEVSAEPPTGAVKGSELADKRPELFHQITPVLVLENEAGPPQRVAAATPQLLAHWVYQPVFLTAAEDKDGLRYTLRVADREVLASGSLTTVRRAVLELTWHFKDKNTVWQRELFDRAHTPGEVPGHAAPAAGDRYGVTVAAGKLVPDVLATRIRMLEMAEHTPVSSGVQRALALLGAKYHVDTDFHTTKLIEQTKVEAAWTAPRLIVTASEGPRADEPKGPPPGLSIDVLSDRVEAQGPRTREFHVARGLANDLIETRIVYEATKMPVISASTILSRLHAETPETPQRRLVLIANAVRRLAADEPIGTRLKLQGLPPGVEQGTNPSKDKEPPTLIVERQKDGVVLIGAGENAEVAKGKVTDRYRWEPEKVIAFADNAEALAVVADCLLGQQLQCVDYVLQLRMQSGWPIEPLPVTAGSVLQYAVNLDGKKFGLDVLVGLKNGVPGGAWSSKPAEAKDSWVDSEGRIGEVHGRWPDVLSNTPLGPAFESFLAAPGFGLEGEAVQVKVSISNQVRVLNAVKVPWPQKTSSLAAVEQAGKWYPAELVRKQSLLQRNDETYHVHFLGAKPVNDAWAPSKSLQSLRAAEVEVKGQWRLAHILKTEGESSQVQLLGEAATAREWVPPARLRPVRLVEAQLEGQWQPAIVLEAKDDKFQVRLPGADAGKAAWLGKEHVRLCEVQAGKSDYLVVLPGSQLPLLLEGQCGNTSFKIDLVSPVLTGRIVDRETGQPVAGATLARGDGKWQVHSAADGSFALHLDDPFLPMVSFVMSREVPPYLQHPSVRRPREFKMLLVLDQSARMTFGLDPDSSAESPAGKQRQDALRKEVMRFLGCWMSNQDSGQATVWTYAAPPGYKGTFAEPEHVTEIARNAVLRGGSPRHPQFTAVEELLPKLQAGGEAPLTAVISKLAGVGLKVPPTLEGGWQWIGPFDNPNQDAFNRVYPPEKEIDLAKAYEGQAGQKVSWKPFEDFAIGKVVNLARFPNNNNIFVYLYREVVAKQAMDLPISLGSDDSVAVWLNGEQILAKNVERAIAPDQDRAVLKLKAGKNNLLLRVGNRAGDFAVYLRPDLGSALDPQTPVVLFTTGVNACASPSAAEAYVAGNCRMPIHIFGMGVKPGSPEESELRKLAVVSGGSMRLADPKNNFVLPLGAFTAQAGNLTATVSEPCHLPATLEVPLAEAGLKPRDIALLHQCQCQDKGKAKEKRLLIIGKHNLADLDQCEGLTPRGRKLIQERVADGAWTVTIPTQRVNIAGVTAYGWFETEVASGRMVGRTEDGLHGATPASGGWPNFNPYKNGPFKQAANQLPFVAWYQGVVAYTAGSVQAALMWHRQPGFLNGSPADFKRFVQANALDFTAGWWDKVGAKSFPEHVELFWSGVCLNYTLQSEALGMPPDNCLRRWAENLCNRASDATKEKGKDLAGKALQGYINGAFGEEFGALISAATKAGNSGLVQELNQYWDNGVREGFNCERFRAKD